MGRGFGVLCSTVALVTVLAAATACEPVLVPARRPVLLPEPAPASAQWIVDLVAALNLPPQCPEPTRSTMTVLDTDGQDRAVAFWMVDSLDVCYAIINHRDVAPTTIWFAAVEDLLTRTPMPADTTAGLDSYAFTAYRGRVAQIEVSGDPDHLVSPVRLRTIDLGAADLVTFAAYHYRIPATGRPLSLSLCTPAGACRDAH
ncbi:hypothetical protein BX285_3553 [Streptomyces sp. 1114.5]|uniref:hypothetical protein n=1 Tax=Streptomyces sp. 1114.5 TaxID=1938830 RepID=UPI000EAE8E6F|nr:hypothetical protein [Streptomyces sp. 1114.5]RKT19102.1 hypothetical protein BX285_3553 [Streptomyces sp. 1114.5]